MYLWQVVAILAYGLLRPADSFICANLGACVLLLIMGIHLHRRHKDPSQDGRRTMEVVGCLAAPDLSVGLATRALGVVAVVKDW
jgi:hypothetical protein